MNNNDEMPLHWASFKGHANVTQALLFAKGTDIEATTIYGETPLHLASHNDHADVAALLLLKGANVEAAKDNGKLTLLDLASGNGHANVAAVFSLKRAAIETNNSNDETPLHWVCHEGHSDVAEALPAKGADIKATNIDRTPLNFG